MTEPPLSQGLDPALPYKVIQIPKSKQFLLVSGFRHAETRALESLTSENLLTIEIRNPSSTDEESEIQFLEFRIHNMESRI